MGQKTHPVGFRLGIIRDWQSKWYARLKYAELLREDLLIRKLIRKVYAEAGISLVEVERQANQVTVTIHTARPGIVIGRGGQKVEELRNQLERETGRRVRINIQEVRQPELEAVLVARNVADQIQRRISHRRALKQAVMRTMQSGAQGAKITVSGRLGGSEMSRTETERSGRVPLHTLRADIDYGFTEAQTTLGRIGVKVWIYRGDIRPEAKEPPARAPEIAAQRAPAAPQARAGAPKADEPATPSAEES
ncbi:MAG: 30S ribosomal protein S3 [Chloroflexi bacterium]|nr:30S ribosomal protein S3 [Chloroflexota bacterium]